MRLKLDLHAIRSARCRAFTLIELLAVIVIIGILAGLSVGVAGLVSRRSKESRVKAELVRLETAIRAYKARFGFYPPDNLRNATNLIVNPVVNQLYYELNGAVYNRASDRYVPVGATTNEGIDRVDYMAVFGNGNFQGIFNSSESAANVQNFLNAARPDQVTDIGFATLRYRALTVPIEWPHAHWRTDPGVAQSNYDPRFFPPFTGLTTDRLQLRINPWRYNSSNPTNNPGEFDLWAEFVIGNELVTIGNWQDEQ